ncbi:hypothetical protein HUJ04_006358 [Dendroctonus ponderosae]
MNYYLCPHRNLSFAFLLLCTYVAAVQKPELPKVRGISTSRVGFYDPELGFTCLDGSKTIPFTQVNDDYCDCSDGSDEPGTSACPHGSFYCFNVGHKPQVIPSYRVNDGICDCCDGSDEYFEDHNCTNDCLRMGKEARENAARWAVLFNAGKQLRADLSQEGQKIKNEKQQKLNKLRINQEEAEKIKAEREQIKIQAEEAENKALEYYRELEEEHKKKKEELEAERSTEQALEYFKKLDSNGDNLIEVAEIQSRQTFDRDRNGEVSAEEAKLFLSNQESVDQETFIERTWKLMKPFVERESGMYQSAGEAESVPEHEDSEQPEDEEEHEDDEEEEEPEQSVGTQEPENVPYDEETTKLVETATIARNQYSESEKDVRTITDEITRLEDSLKKDFGVEEEFASLEGQCFDYQDHEYIYKLCPFEKTLQIPKSNSMETNLGRWSRWDGAESNLYSKMLYENGQNCWNGPNRSTKVSLFCGTENKITSVAEPNRCEYAFEFETPAACYDPSNQESQSDVHDEL